MCNCAVCVNLTAPTHAVILRNHRLAPEHCLAQRNSRIRFPHTLIATLHAQTRPCSRPTLSMSSILPATPPCPSISSGNRSCCPSGTWKSKKGRPCRSTLWGVIVTDPYPSDRSPPSKKFASYGPLRGARLLSRLGDTAQTKARRPLQISRQTYPLVLHIELPLSSKKKFLVTSKRILMPDASCPAEKSWKTKLSGVRLEMSLSVGKELASVALHSRGVRQRTQTHEGSGAHTHAGSGATSGRESRSSPWP